MSTTAEPEPAARILLHQPWPFRHCPSCGHEDFEVSCHTGQVVFSCQGCERSWRYVLGFIQELPPEPASRPVPVGGDAGPATMPVAGQG